MKHVLMIAVMAILTVGAFAQSNTFDNQSGCDLQIRAICIDEANCTHTVSSGWVNLPDGAVTSFASIVTGCATPNVQGFELRYDPSTSCTGSMVFTTNPATPCDPHHLNYWPGDAPMPACSCNMGPHLQIAFDSNGNIFRTI